jgi:malonyl CoA-acyl carrier protein transacylase
MLFEVVMESRSNGKRRALMTRVLETSHANVDGGTFEARETVTSANVDVESMDAFEVLFLLCKSEGLVVAGDPKQAFAHVDSITGMLHVYARDKDAVEISSNATKTMLAALEVVLKEGASLSSSSDTAVCVLGDVTARGYTYGEAALRALAKRQIASEFETVAPGVKRGT